MENILEDISKKISIKYTYVNLVISIGELRDIKVENK